MVLSGSTEIMYLNVGGPLKHLVCHSNMLSMFTRLHCSRNRSTVGTNTESILSFLHLPQSRLQTQRMELCLQ